MMDTPVSHVYDKVLSGMMLVITYKFRSRVVTTINTAIMHGNIKAFKSLNIPYHVNNLSGPFLIFSLFMMVTVYCGTHFMSVILFP